MLTRFVPDRHVDCNFQSMAELGVLGWLRASGSRSRVLTAMMYLNDPHWTGAPWPSTLPQRTLYGIMLALTHEAQKAANFVSTTACSGSMWKTMQASGEIIRTSCHGVGLW